MTLTIYITERNGTTAVIQGHKDAVHAIEMALTKAGWKYHEPSGSWDEGYHKEGHSE